MTQRLLNLLNNDFVLKLLVWAAAITFVISVIFAFAPAIRLIGEHPVTAILSVIIALSKSLYQPAILLALAKLISMRKAT